MTAVRHPVRLAASAWLALVIGLGLAAPLIGYDPVLDVDPTALSEPASWEHPLGTDYLGRDTLRRLIRGCRALAWPGLLACGVAALLGVPAGALSGFYGGAPRLVLRYVLTVVASVPRFVLALLVLTIYGNDLLHLAVAAGVAYAPSLAESVHERIERLRAREFVLANQAHGVPDWRILWVHLVWAACRRRIARHLLALFGGFVVLETTLAYIGGYGVQQPEPSWGNLLAFEWGRQAWTSPGMLVPVAVLWLTLLSTGLAIEGRGDRGG